MGEHTPDMTRRSFLASLASLFVVGGTAIESAAQELDNEDRDIFSEYLAIRLELESILRGYSEKLERDVDTKLLEDLYRLGIRDGKLKRRLTEKYGDLNNAPDAFAELNFNPLARRFYEDNKDKTWDEIAPALDEMMRQRHLGLPDREIQYFRSWGTGIFCGFDSKFCPPEM